MKKTVGQESVRNWVEKLTCSAHPVYCLYVTSESSEKLKVLFYYNTIVTVSVKLGVVKM